MSFLSLVEVIEFCLKTLHAFTHNAFKKWNKTNIQIETTDPMPSSEI